MNILSRKMVPYILSKIFSETGVHLPQAVWSAILKFLTVSQQEI